MLIGTLGFTHSPSHLRLLPRDPAAQTSPQECSPYPTWGKTVLCSVSTPRRWSSAKTNTFGVVEGQGAVDTVTCPGGTHGAQVITCLSLPACKIGANNAGQGMGTGRGSSPIPRALGTRSLQRGIHVSYPADPAAHVSLLPHSPRCNSGLKVRVSPPARHKKG